MNTSDQRDALDEISGDLRKLTLPEVHPEPSTELDFQLTRLSENLEAFRVNAFPGIEAPVDLESSLLDTAIRIPNLLVQSSANLNAETERALIKLLITLRSIQLLSSTSDEGLTKLDKKELSKSILCTQLDTVCELLHELPSAAQDSNSTLRKALLFTAEALGVRALEMPSFVELDEGYEKIMASEDVQDCGETAPKYLLEAKLEALAAIGGDEAFEELKRTLKKHDLGDEKDYPQSIKDLVRQMYTASQGSSQ